MKKLLLSLSLFFSISNASALTISHVGEQFLGHGVSDLRKLCKMLDSSQWPLET